MTTPYIDDLMKRMNEKLETTGFERYDQYTWVFTFPDGIKYIKLEIQSEEIVAIDFNGEEQAFQSPYGVMSGLEVFMEAVEGK